MQRHTTDPFALVFGLLFAGIGLAVLAGWGPISVLRLDLLIPVLAIAAGLGFLASARRRAGGRLTGG